jgi:hypothetical protein
LCGVGGLGLCWWWVGLLLVCGGGVWCFGGCWGCVVVVFGWFVLVFGVGVVGGVGCVGVVGGVEGGGGGLCGGVWWLYRGWVGW